MRLDRAKNAADPDNVPDVKFTQTNPGFRVTSGPASVLWDAKNSATGVYSLKGTFRLMKPSGHVNYYGLVFGGSGLDNSRQTYLYFLVAQNGTYVIKHRAGDSTTHEVQGRTPHPAIVQPDSTGSSVNRLEVRVAFDRISYYVNGSLVQSMPKTGMVARTDGLWGVRVNHLLDVRVEGLGVSK